jgi:hypothetical protein
MTKANQASGQPPGRRQHLDRRWTTRSNQRQPSPLQDQALIPQSVKGGSTTRVGLAFSQHPLLSFATPALHLLHPQRPESRACHQVARLPRQPVVHLDRRVSPA